MSRLSFSIEDEEDFESTLEHVDDYVTQRDEGIQQFNGNFEAQAHYGLKQAIGALKPQIARSRGKLKPLEVQLKELEAEEASLESQRKSALRNMAAAGLRRVGAPDEASKEVRTFKGEALMMATVELNAESDTFNNLYSTLREFKPDLPEWTCSASAAKWPERDLLGMCPGGKPHLTKEVLDQKKMLKCPCLICVCAEKKKAVTEEIKEVSMEVNELKHTISWSVARLRQARNLKRRLRGSDADDDDEEHNEDPVFYGDQNFEAEDEATEIAHQHARQEWARLESSLQVSDFPLRVVFLDKSGSMGCDQITFDALQLAFYNCVHPTSGSTITFLFAAPGETEIMLRRPNDPPMSFHIRLGSATWFNEPIVRTLRFLAPLIEHLDTKSWIQQHGQPPLQVLCMTDGMDNVSASNMRSLASVVREIKEINGPQTHQKLYMPIAGPLRKHSSILDSENPKVPVWLAWIACGMGGNMLLNVNQPKEIMLIDAVAAPQCRDPQALMDAQMENSQAASQRQDDRDRQRLSVEKSTVASRVRQRISAASAPSTDLAAVQDSKKITAKDAHVPLWSVGHRVRIKANQPGRAPKTAVVVRVMVAESVQYDILLDDETQATVAESDLIGSPLKSTTMLKARPGQAMKSGQLQQGIFARTADPDAQRLQVLAVVESATTDLAAIMESCDSTETKDKKDSIGKPKSVALEDAVKRIQGSEEVEGEAASRLEDRVKVAKRSLPVSSTPKLPPADPAAVLLEVLLAAGRSAAKLLPEDRLVAQRFLSVGLEMLVSGGNLIPSHICDHLSAFVNIHEVNAVRRIRVEQEELENWQQTLTSPLRSVLEVFVQNRLLETIQTAGFDAVIAHEEARSCIVAVWRFFDPSLTRSGWGEDSLRRAVNRCQRLQPAFTFGKRRSESSIMGKGEASSSEETRSPESESGSTSSASSGSRFIDQGISGPRMLFKRGTMSDRSQGSNQPWSSSSQRTMHSSPSASQEPAPQYRNSPAPQSPALKQHRGSATPMLSRISRTPPSSPDSEVSQCRLPSIGSRRSSKDSKDSKPSTPDLSIRPASSYARSPQG